MVSLGDKLKNARNEKDLSLDHISREIGISVRFLEALESEDFSAFPGEPYLIGFLRNYSSYLELDIQKVLSLYRTLRIQEQPVPVEQLLKKPAKIPVFLIIVFVILLIIGAGGWGIYSFLLNRQHTPVEVTPVVRVPVEYTMEGSSLERRLHVNDSVLISVDSDIYRFELYDLGATVTIRTPAGMEILDLGQEIRIDLNSDGVLDLRITVADFARNNPGVGASLHFHLIDAAALADIDTETDFPFVASAATTVATTIIPSSPSAYPFTLQVNFQGFCMFRWEILNERDRRGTNQRFFQRNETLEIQAQNGIRIWASNATAARFQVIGAGRTFPVEIGTAGEVVVTDIRWVRDEDGRFRVVLIRQEI